MVLPIAAEVIDHVHAFSCHPEHPDRLEFQDCHGAVSNDDDSAEGSSTTSEDMMDGHSQCFRSGPTSQTQ